MAGDFRRAGFWKTAIRRALYGVAGLLGLVIVWVGGWLLWRVFQEVRDGSAEELNKLLLALAGLLGAPFLVWRTWIADQQKTIAQEELYTGLLVKAVEQLGATREEKTYEIHETEDDLFGLVDRRPNGLPVKRESVVRTVPNTEVRLGAIYALEKLAHDYLPLHWQIMEIFCAYVRKNAGPPKLASEEIRAIYAKDENSRTDKEQEMLKARRAELKPPFVDVQAALTVIGRRSKRQREFEEKRRSRTEGGSTRLDLTDCHLATANLTDLNFERVSFSRSCLERADFFGAQLKGARLCAAHLEGARLDDANLERARLGAAHLERAGLNNANLEGARLIVANLEGAYLSGAIGLTQRQLDVAIGDEKTTIPENLTRPENIRWRNGETRQGEGG